jgi:feruloyl esterase
LRAIYRGPRNPSNDRSIFPGLERGGELGGPLGWGVVVTGPAPGQAADVALASAFMTGLAFEDPDYNIFTFDFDDDMEFVDDKLADILNATNPNLKAFSDNGGKLIMYHGWSDGIVAPRNSINYYREVSDKAGSRRKAMRFARLFMAPGMDHCIGGSGPFAFDPIAALEGWVEGGVAPDSMLAFHLAGNGAGPGAPDRSRPLCRFPLVAIYDGSGDINDASNFTCGRRAGDGDGEDGAE